MCGWRLGGGARLQHPRNEIIECLMMARRCTSDSLHCTSPVGCTLCHFHGDTQPETVLRRETSQRLVHWDANMKLIDVHEEKRDPVTQMLIRGEYGGARHRRPEQHTL